MAKNSIYEQTSRAGKWVLHDKKIMWQSTFLRGVFNKTLQKYIFDDPIITYETPETHGLLKSVEFYIVSFDEIPNMKKRGLKERVYFKQKLTARIKDYEPHLYIMFNTDRQSLAGELTPINKFFIKDLNTGVTFLMSLNDCDVCRITKDEPEVITAQEAFEISQKWNYLFDKVESENGEDSYRVNVSKYIDNPM